MSEIVCPCKDNPTEEECEECQDLPIGYFEHSRKMKKLREERKYE